MMTNNNRAIKVSLIAAVYKDIEALRLIVAALEQQTYKNFELIVAEDNNSEDMSRYINSIKSINIKHTQQDDNGIRKSRSINNAILESTGEYLIFIDGDCVPYTTFIEGHVALAQKGQILSGRRVNLGPQVSGKIRNNVIRAEKIEKNYLVYWPSLLLDQGTHLEQGLRFDNRGFIYRNMISRRKRNTSLLGCNFSCFRDDMFAINGFDESYEGTAVADDTDLEWRFKGYGCSIVSCKNIANVFHLYHTSEHRDIDSSKEVNMMMERKKKNLFVCEKGLAEH